MKMEPPPNLKQVIAQMRNLSEFMLDLAYSAALYGSKELAEQVLELEKKMDDLAYKGKISALLCVRDLEDAKSMLPVLRIIWATDKISDAAGDIAKIPILGLGIPPELKSGLLNAHESVAQFKLTPGSEIAGMDVRQLESSYPGIKVLAIKRGGEWILDPSGSEKLAPEDLVFLKGSRDAWEGLSRGLERELAQPSDLHPMLSKLMELVVEMKNSADLSLDLAYLSVLYDSNEAAMEVKLLESQLDGMSHEFELLLLESARWLGSCNIHGLLHFSRGFELISDAAYEIADTVLRDLIPHQILSEAFRQSEEEIIKLEVGPDSDFCEKTPAQIHRENPELYVLGVNKSGKWIHMPKDIKIQKGDLLILRSSKRS